MLQDNGGDNLSVSANGSFTFATRAGRRGGLQRDGEDEPVGAGLHGVERVGHGRSANVTNVAVTCAANSATSASDDFNRADGGLGANWTAISDGGMAISSQQVTGTAGVLTGDMWTAESFASDQYREVAGHLDAADRGPVGGRGGAGPERRAERLRRHLLLELRQPGAEAVQADRDQQLDAAGQRVQLRGAGGRDAAGGRGGGQHDLVLAERRQADLGHR